MKIIIATTNKNKVNRIKKMFKAEDYEFFCLDEIISDISEPIEKGETPMDIAIQKAMYYSNYCPDEYIILTQDDTIKFENIKKEDDYGLHIKEPVVNKYGKFTDELAAKYYTELANKYGGSISMIFNYGHAVAKIVSKQDRKIKKIVGAGSKLEVRLVNKINKLEEVPGYFLSAIMQAKVNGEWKNYNDLDEETLIRLDKDLYNSISSLLNEIK